MDLRVGGRGDTDKQIAQIEERILTVLHGTLDQAVVDSGSLTPALAISEKIVYTELCINAICIVRDYVE